MLGNTVGGYCCVQIVITVDKSMASGMIRMLGYFLQDSHPNTALNFRNIKDEHIAK